MSKIDTTARGSDVPRSYKQYLCRKFGAAFVYLFRLNQAGYVTTEIVQRINPICKIPTSFGNILCKGGHGRLRWRAETFYTEEPQTISWLDKILQDDILWDIGANVGLYSIYAAKKSGCRVIAFEPEAQNYALLVENIILNELDNVEPSNLAISRTFGLGRLHVHDLTKGGAYNQFESKIGSPDKPEGNNDNGVVSQIQIGVSVDDLVNRFDFDCPTHIKIDVDGIEPEIIAGAKKVLGNDTCRHVLIEVETDNPIHSDMIESIKQHGFHLISERSNWLSRDHQEKFAQDYPVTNMIFEKDANRE